MVPTHVENEGSNSDPLLVAAFYKFIQLDLESLQEQ